MALDPTTRTQPLVTVVVVSFNTGELLVRCLCSLEPDVEAGRAQVVVVDNGSTDGSAVLAREHAPWARILEPGANLGFGSAVNLGARQSTSEWLAVANADVALETGALERLLASGEGSRAGAIAPRLILPNGSTQHSVGPLPTIPLALAFNLGLHRLSPRLGDRLCLEGCWNADRRREVPWAIGAFLLLRRSAFDAVGGFDERQWMYAEDLDLGWRLRLGGWSTLYEPSARVQHASGAATSVAFGEQRIARFTSATYGVLLRRRGILRVWATAALNAAGAAARLGWMTPLAAVIHRWRGPRADTRRWLVAHLRALRAPSALRRDAEPEH